MLGALARSNSKFNRLSSPHPALPCMRALRATVVPSMVHRTFERNCSIHARLSYVCVHLTRLPQIPQVSRACVCVRVKSYYFRKVERMRTHGSFIFSRCFWHPAHHNRIYLRIWMNEITPSRYSLHTIRTYQIAALSRHTCYNATSAIRSLSIYLHTHATR